MTNTVTIEIKRSRRPSLRGQKWRITLIHANGNKLLWSERYANQADALDVGYSIRDGLYDYRVVIQT